MSTRLFFEDLHKFFVNFKKYSVSELMEIDTLLTDYVNSNNYSRFHASMNYLDAYVYTFCEWLSFGGKFITSDWVGPCEIVVHDREKEMLVNFVRKKTRTFVNEQN